MVFQLSRRQLLVAGAALCWPRTSFAARAGASLQALIANSDCCVIGRSVAAESSWVQLGGARRIVTLHRVVVSEVVDGDAAPGQELRVRTLGGVAGDISQRVFGEATLLRDEPSLLFLVRADADVHVVTDMAGGCFPIANDALGVARVHAAAERASSREAEPSAADVLEGASVDDARAMLRDVAWRLHAR